LCPTKDAGYDVIVGRPHIDMADAARHSELPRTRVVTTQRAILRPRGTGVTVGLPLDREATERYQRRLRARLRYARLRHQASVEDVDYRAARGLDRTLFQALIAGRWIEEAQNLIIEGPAGVGKSWLCLRARSKGLSRQSLGTLPADPTDVRRSGIGSR
jgi:DNA replication protein DnaC